KPVGSGATPHFVWDGTKWVPGKVSFDDLADVPDAFPPTAHGHDDRYYTQGEIDDLLDGIGGGEPGGNDGQIQFNNEGTFAGGPFWDAANSRLAVANTEPAAGLSVGALATAGIDNAVRLGALVRVDDWLGWAMQVINDPNGS